MNKPTVLMLDTLDDRREVVTSQLAHLKPDERLAYLEWVCEFAWLTRPAIRLAMSSLKPDYNTMRPIALKARSGCAVASNLLTNHVWTDLYMLCHEFRVDYLACVIELENRAKGREPTPAQYAAMGFLEFESLQRLRDPRPAAALAPPLQV